MSLPSSGSLSLKNAAGAGRSISQEVDGNEVGNKSLTTLSVTAGKTTPHGILEFYGYPAGPALPGTTINCTSTLGDYFGEGEVTTINIAWTQPVSGGTPDHYRIELSENGGAYSTLDTVIYGGGNTYSHNAGLVSGNTYEYKIFAVNVTGDGPSCGPTTLITFPSTPNIPQSVVLTSDYPDGMITTWSAPSGGDTPQGYRVEWYTSPGHVLVTNEWTNLTTLTIPDALVADGGVYTAEVTAYTAAGYGTAAVSAAETYEEDVVPVSSVTTTVDAGTGIDVSWVFGVGGGTPDGVKISISVNGGAFSLIDTVAYPTTTYADTGLVAGNNYQYSVVAYNGANDAAGTLSDTDTYCTGAPQAPTSATANVVSNDVTLSWSLSGSGPAAENFRIERQPQSTGVWSFLADVAAGAGNTYADNDLPSDQYQYRVRGENDCGNSVYTSSNSVVVM